MVAAHLRQLEQLFKPPVRGKQSHGGACGRKAGLAAWGLLGAARAAVEADGPGVRRTADVRMLTDCLPACLTVCFIG